MNPRRLDAITVDLNGSHLIEASAGTGKTYAIATLFVRFLLEVRLRVSEILVVTYTNAATGELRLRIRDRLRRTLAALDAGRWPDDESLDAFIRERRACGMASLQHDRALLLTALHSFDEAAIFTMHGFCQRVLHEYAFESGADFEVELLASLNALTDEIVHDYWIGRLHGASQELLHQLHSKSPVISVETLRRIAAAIVLHPDAVLLPAAQELRSRGNDLDTEVLRLLLEFADYARKELQRRKLVARVQSFDDLLHRLRAALTAEGGDRLAQAVRQRYRAALIDEFQDTDPVQYDIFRRIYGDAAPLFLIGDPKQAIYAFRGADIFTYMSAQREVAAMHTLLTNRRSDPALLRAINTIFERASPAFLFEDIGYEAIEPAAGARDRLGGSRFGKPPFEILFVRREGLPLSKQPPHGILKEAALRYVSAAVAERVAAFLNEGVTLLEDHGERPLQPSDIAILCRRNREALAVQEALRKLRIHAVLQGDATVFETPAAAAVERALRALANPADGPALRAALASPLIGLDASELFALETDEQQWEEWSSRFHDWHDLWLGRGFIVAFRRLLDDLEIERRLLAQVGGERLLTDVLHLVELLHRAGTDQRLGPQGLVRWLTLMRGDDGSRDRLFPDADRIRLESDEAAVKLMTIHRSKGLEYPVVFCPFSWTSADLYRAERTVVRFHDHTDGNRLKLDLGSEQLKAHLQRAEREALAENLRLLYVAFTRARHYCAVIWGAFRGSTGSALGYLLHHHRGEQGDDPARATERRLKKMADEDLLADLQELARMSGNTIAVVPLRREEKVQLRSTTRPEAPLVLPETRACIHTHWRVSSFTALTASPEAPLSLPAEEGLDHDAELLAAVAANEPAATPAESLPFGDLPASAGTGQLIHSILERLDFQIVGSAALRAEIERLLPDTAPERAWIEQLASGIETVLDTPLGGAAGLLCLRQINPASRLNELDFLLPAGRRRNPGLTPASLAKLLARHARTAPERQYAERAAQLGFPPLEGYLHGFIDLVFEHNGKWYLVDYKSNRLGTSAADYAPAALEETMSLHHYRLQYLLYTVALHRYLAQRLAGYDYDRHFGGVYYLFLRGMAPHHPHGSGIFHDRPARQLIEDLSLLLEAGEIPESDAAIPPPRCATPDTLETRMPSSEISSDCGPRGPITRKVKSR